ncbi:MAG: hypothetical protein VB051_09160 [Candidatus Pelethousia sp.]|nr:hypothetical protein [Candidatus Pelethousia sp.]
MINIFNRREVCLTRSMDEQARVRSLLNGLGIETHTISGNLNRAGRHHGIPGIDLESAYEYYVYVHKKDYDRARQALHST